VSTANRYVISLVTSDKC